METQINKALAQREALLQKNILQMKQQADISAKICDSLKCGKLKDMERAAKGTKNALNQVAESAKGAGNEIQSAMDEAARKAGEAAERMQRLKKITAALAVAGAAFSGFKRGLSLVTNGIRGLAKAAGGVIGTLFRLGKTILALPFRILSGLFAGGGGGVSAYRVALEELRKEMGDFRKGPAKSVVAGLKGMRKEFGSGFFKAGSFAKVFGYGREGMAAALKFSMEMMKGIGPIAHTMGAEFEANAGKLAKFQKALGMSAEDMGGIVAKSKAAGKDYLETFTEIEKFADHMEDAFNISKKVISRETAKMMNDIGNFGDMSTRELVELTTQTIRLGVSMKALQGIVDGFDNFEKAADSAAMLRRQFGMIIDAEKIMNMNAGERLAYLQEQFKASGRSFEDMGRIEKKIFARRVNMDIKEAQMAFGKKALEKDFNKVKKEGDKAQKKQLTTAQALMRLSRQIERVFGGGGGQLKGFFHAWVTGFTRGIKWSKEFRRALINIRMSLRVVRYSAMQTGRAFVQHFPGVKQFLGALADFFDPRYVMRNMNMVNAAFTKFFQTVGNPGKTRAALENLMKDLLGIVKKFFGGKGAAAREGFKGLDTILTLYGNIKLMLLEKSMEQAASFLEAFTDALNSYINGNTNISKSFGKVGTAMSERFGESFGRLGQVFQKKLFPALERAVPVLFKAFQFMMGKMMDYLDQNPGIYKNLVMGFGRGLLFMWRLKVDAIIALLMNKDTRYAVLTLLAIPIGFMLVKGIMSAVGMYFSAKALAAAMGVKMAGGGLFATMFGGGVLAKAGTKLGAGVSKMFGMVGLKNPKVAQAASKVGGGLLKVFATPLTSKTGQKFMAKATAKGLGAALKVGVKSIPVAGWVLGAVIDAAFSLEDGFNEYQKTGRMDKALDAFGGAFVSNFTFGLVSKDTGKKIFRAAAVPLTTVAAAIEGFTKEGGGFMKGLQMAGASMLDAVSFGLLDADRINDMIDGTNNYGKKVAEQLSAATEAVRLEINKKVDPMIKKSKAQIDQFRKDYRDFTTDITEIRVRFADSLTEADKTALMAYANTQGIVKKGSAEDQKIIDQMGKQVKEAALMGAKLQEAIKAERGTFFDTDAMLAGGTAAENQLIKDFAYELQKELGGSAAMRKKGLKNYLTEKDGTVMLQLDDDVYTKHAGALKRAAEKAFDPETMARKMKEFEADAINKQTQRVVMALSDKDMIQARLAAMRAGATDVAAKIESQMSEKSTLVAMKEALDKQPMAFDPATLDKRGIKAAFNEMLDTVEKQHGKMAADVMRAEMKDRAAQGRSKLIDESLTVAELQTKKLAQLQAANETIQQINKLAKVPQQLVKAKNKLAKINEKAIQRDIDRLMVKVKSISAYIVESVEKHGLNKPKEIISGTISRNFMMIAELRKQLDLMFKKVIPRSTLVSRARTLKVYIDKAGEIAAKLKTDPNLNTAISNIPAGNAMTLQGVMQGLAGPSGALTVASANINKKIALSQRAISAAGKIISQLNAMPQLKAIIQLGTALNQQQTLTIKTAKTRVTLNLSVKVDSSEFAKKMIQADIMADGQMTKIATQKDVKDANR